MFQSNPVNVQQVILMIIYLFIIQIHIITSQFSKVKKEHSCSMFLDAYRPLCKKDNNVEKRPIKDNSTLIVIQSFKFKQMKKQICWRYLYSKLCTVKAVKYAVTNCCWIEEKICLAADWCFPPTAKHQLWFVVVEMNIFCIHLDVTRCPRFYFSS